MADIYTSRQDEDTIDLVLEKGLCAKLPKWKVLRIALAQSLRIPTSPDDALNKFEDRGSEYHLEQVSGAGAGNKEGEERRDFNDAFRALLSVYYDRNLMADSAAYKKYLQLHIRRGLREIRTGWRENHDFHEYLYQELFSGSMAAKEISPAAMNALQNALAEIGVHAEIRTSIQGPRLTRYALHLPDVHDLDHLHKGMDKLSFSLGLGTQGVFTAPTAEPKMINLDVPRARDTWHPVAGEKLKEWALQTGLDAQLPVWPGVDVMGQPYFFDLASAPHLLVGGTTGSGKSVCLHALLLSLLWRQNPVDLRLCLIDPKRVEFEPYQRLGNLWGERVINDADSAMMVLDELVEEMETRINQLAEVGVRDLAEGRAKNKLDLPYIVAFVEELADLLMQNRDVENPLIRLAQKARATGIHLVIATQRPDADTFSGLLRSNIPARIALKVQKPQESKIILDEVGAEKLTGYGDMLVKTAQGVVTRVHGAMALEGDIADCLGSEERQ